MTEINAVRTPEQSCEIVHGLFDGVMRDGKSESFVIQSGELRANGDYWVIRSNSEDYVVHGMTEFCYVSVNAHLINVMTATPVRLYGQDFHSVRSDSTFSCSTSECA